MFAWIKKIVSTLWKALTLIRQSLANIVFLLLMLALGVYFFASEPETVEDNSVLVVKLSGTIVEKASMGDEERMLALALSDVEPETKLSDVVETFRRAADDHRITSILLKLDSLGRVGLASVREIGQAMDHFKKSGKKITVWGASFTQRQYAIAAHASEVYLNPMGQVMLKGLSSERLYWGELLKKAGVTVHVFKAGDFKSFPESFVRNSPSAESLEADRFWLTDAWEQLSVEIERARGLMPGSVHRMIENMEVDLVHASGRMSEVALANNLIDAVKTNEEVNALLLERQGAKKTEHRLKTVDMLTYLSQLPRPEVKGRGVGVITLEGEIIEGESDIGHIGAKTVIREIKRVRQDPNIAVLVVRLDSPGGSAQASEMIRHELEVTRKSGKRIVVSMGDMAASGGYWISMAADKIVADPMTVTGSIGVFGLLPTFEKTLEMASVGAGGVKTEWISGSEQLTSPLHPRMQTLLRLTVARTYEDFVSLVAQSRKLSVNAVKELAQGKVYMGRQAVRVGLADTMGGLDDALYEARKIGKLDAEAPVHFIEEPLGKMGSLLEKILLKCVMKLNFNSLANVFSIYSDTAMKVSEIENPLNRLRTLTQSPTGVVAHSFAEIQW